MLKYSIVFFVLAMLVGLYLLSRILRNKSVSKRIALAHGALAVIGLMILIYYSWLSGIVSVGLILLILAAIGGLTMMYRSSHGQLIPKWMALGHGITAIAGIALLAYKAFFAVILAG